MKQPISMKVILIVFLSGFARSSIAQKVNRDNLTKPKKIKPVRTELSGGFRFNTDGWSIFADKGYNRYENAKTSDMFYNTFIIQAELGEKKHAKEVKSANQNLSSAINDKTRPFIFGKINNFYQFKVGVGFRRLIAGKPEQKTISIHWVYVGGFSLGMEKPYYIDAYVPQDNGATLVRESIKYDDSTKTAFLNQPYIIGASSFTKGLSEIKFVPGLHVKTGLHFDFANKRDLKMAIETGVSAEVYSRPIQIMANQTAVPYFVNIYASIQFGKRW